MRVFCRIKENYHYYNLDIASAARGFEAMGFDVQGHFNISDYIDEISKRDIVVDGIFEIQKVLNKHGRDISNFNYPPTMDKPSDLIGCGSYYDNIEILCCEALDIKRGYRAFIINDKIVDIRPYCGDYHYNYDANVVDTTMKSFTEWNDRPMGCGIDFGVTSKGNTILVEVKDGYSLKSYGLDSLLYAKLLSARWSQVMDRPDECVF